MVKTLEGPGSNEDSAVSVAADVITQLVGRVPAGELTRDHLIVGRNS